MHTVDYHTLEQCYSALKGKHIPTRQDIALKKYDKERKREAQTLAKRTAKADKRGCAVADLDDSSTDSTNSCTNTGTEGKPPPKDRKRKRTSKKSDADSSASDHKRRNKKSTKKKKKTGNNCFKARPLKKDAKGNVVLTGYKDARLDVTRSPPYHLGLMVATPLHRVRFVRFPMSLV